MKNRSWLGFVSALLLLGASRGAEENLKQLEKTAASLDEVVVQKKQKVQLYASGAVGKKTAEPLDLNRITTIVSTNLNIDQRTLKELLANDRKKLSEIVLAQQLGLKTSQPWRELLEKHQPGELLSRIQQEGETANTQKAMDSLLTELSFAALDQMAPDQAIGRPAAGTTGTNSSKSSAEAPKAK
jgi:hypothetical protein